MCLLHCVSWDVSTTFKTLLLAEIEALEREDSSLIQTGGQNVGITQFPHEERSQNAPS
jgi:hypothetical protein